VRQNLSKFLPCLALVPCLMALAKTQRVPQGKAVTGDIDRPPLVFSQYAVSLGEIPATGVVPAHFDYWNRGDQAIEITEITPSCGCLAPRIVDEKRVLQPGERGRFYVSVKTANETPGPKDYTVQVKYKDQQPREEIVRFHLDVPERKVTVTPSEVYFYQLTGQPDSRTILVQDHRGQRLNVTDVQVTSELATVAMGAAKEGEGGVWENEIRVDVPGEVPNGRKIALIKIQTDDIDYPLITVPLLIQGPEKSSVQLTSGEEEVKSP